MTRRLLLSSSLLCAATFAVATGAQAPASAPAAGSLRWFKGNTHTHTLNSDGDSTPDDVVRWYREHGYHFLVLTDHNFLTDVDGLNALHGADDKFLVIKGEEVSSTFEGKPLHINGLDRLAHGRAAEGEQRRRVLQKQRRCHPRRPAACRTSTIRTSDGPSPPTTWPRLRNNRLFEIYNGHPMVNNLGGTGHPGLEEIWDTLLSQRHPPVRHRRPTTPTTSRSSTTSHRRARAWAG